MRWLEDIQQTIYNGSRRTLAIARCSLPCELKQEEKRKRRKDARWKQEVVLQVILELTRWVQVSLNIVNMVVYTLVLVYPVITRF